MSATIDAKNQSDDGSSNSVDPRKRRFLIAATSGVAAVGAAAMAVPFLTSWAPSERAKAAGAPVEADLSKLEFGQQLTVEWRGKPVWIVRRTPETLATLETLADSLRDSESAVVSQQPAYAQNGTRSIKPEYGVLVGICTHLGCSPTYRPELGPADLGEEWKGGWYCPCHGSRFDLAGRVYKNVPAPTNLVVPPHKYIADTRILVGEDGESA